MNTIFALSEPQIINQILIANRMQKLRILQVSFDTSIQPYELSAFRGAVARKVGLEHEWFHNHDNENGTTFNRYPLIQYKLDTHKGQMRPMMLCLNEGIDAAHHFFSQPNWSLNIRGKQYDLRIARLDVNTYNVITEKTPFSYRLHKWQALNPAAYKEYCQIDSLASKLLFLEKRLQTHISSFASGIGCHLDTPLSIAITDVLKMEWIEFKHIKILTFTVEFKTNIFLPNYIGLGKGSAMGYGVSRIQNVI